MEHYLFSTTGESTDAEVKVTTPASSPMGTPVTRMVTIKMPVFTYSSEVRLKAAGLLADGRSESPIWGIVEREELIAKFEKLMDDVLTDSVAKLKKTELPKSVILWRDQNQAVKNKMGASSSMNEMGNLLDMFDDLPLATPTRN
jgi:hypothetical protein